MKMRCRVVFDYASSKAGRLLSLLFQRLPAHKFHNGTWQALHLRPCDSPFSNPNIEICRLLFGDLP